MNGRVLLGAAFVGLVALAATMMIESPPKTARIVLPEPTPAAKQAAAAPMSGASAAAPQSVSNPASQQALVIKRVLPISGPIRYGEWHWDDKNVPAGPITVTVDLDARVLSVFRNGYEIGAAAVLIGAEDKPTPLGVFPITQKKRHHTSNLYDAEMPYMQRLTDDGITLHATKVAWGYVSHGCIGMPEDFARKVFETTSVGDKVYITRGKMVGVGDPLTS